jgi:hypothetical protein
MAPRRHGQSSDVPSRNALRAAMTRVELLLALAPEPGVARGIGFSPQLFGGRTAPRRHTLLSSAHHEQEDAAQGRGEERDDPSRPRRPPRLRRQRGDLRDRSRPPQPDPRVEGVGLRVQRRDIHLAFFELTPPLLRAHGEHTIDGVVGLGGFRRGPRSFGQLEGLGSVEAVLEDLDDVRRSHVLTADGQRGEMREELLHAIDHRLIAGHDVAPLVGGSHVTSPNMLRW